MSIKPNEIAYCTLKQYEYIISLAGSCELNMQDLYEKATNVAGYTVYNIREMSIKDASKLIDLLKELRIPF